MASHLRRLPLAFSATPGRGILGSVLRGTGQCCSFSSSNRDDAVDEMNKEFRQVFGEDTSSISPGTLQLEKEDPFAVITEVSPNLPSTSLSHVDAHGKVNMVDVSGKPATSRQATASARVLLGATVFRQVAENAAKKGDVLAAARIAGINGAKQTSNLIPLCHTLPLSHAAVNLTLDPADFSVRIEAEAATVGNTGVEMEALTAASVAALTVYDMCKGVDKGIVITDVRLEAKSGGKSGKWTR